MGPLAGIRVVELAIWGMVPMAGTILSEWGADVIKVEHPETADPMRALVLSGRGPEDAGVNFMWEMHNRGKRGITLDLTKPGAHDILGRLLEEADVFLTNVRVGSRVKLGIDVESVQAINPAIVYASATGMGSLGPEADRGGFDTAAFWARSGLSYKITAPEAESPPDLPSPAFGDILTGQMLAGSIAAALVNRANWADGRGPVLETSLLASGMWAMRNEIAACELFDVDRFFGLERSSIKNPLVAAYRTKDDRFVQLVMLEAELHWPDLCMRLEREDLIADPRFASMSLRADNASECVRVLEEEFGKRTIEEWTKILTDATGVWGVVQTPRELSRDPQVLANEYLVDAPSATGKSFSMVPNPVKFDGAVLDPGPAPDWGEHTDEVLAEVGIEDDQIIDLRISGAIL
ncbi:CoA transferase [Rhodococcus sp. 14C212]|uniref:CaiB/BaiF CoA transferase family protein n=1 Tax=Rhodococcus sp. 14C212 TaxID=2711209 RepID=UPI0013EC0582|nr:CoA transferase [Rhodococcus sp. 14C212]NGP06763.1 CoA transferase [Rhodococcus sp. 14C212]